MAGSDGWQGMDLSFQAQGLDPPAVPMARVGSDTTFSIPDKDRLRREHVMPSKLLPGPMTKERDLSTWDQEAPLQRLHATQP